MGDFNFIMNKDLDRRGDNISFYNSSSCNTAIKRTMISTNYSDTYRLVQGDDRKAFSWFRKSNNGSVSASRIDYIWTSPNLDNYVINANIVKSEGITDSDHMTVILAVDTSRLIRNRRTTKGVSCGPSRKIYLYNEMTDDMWTEFQQTICRSPLIRKAGGKILHIYNKINSNKAHLVPQDIVDDLWTDIVACINTAADATIPFKKVPSVYQERKETKYDPNIPRKQYRLQNTEHRKFRYIRLQIIKLINKHRQLSTDLLIEYNVKLAKINHMFDTNIPLLYNNQDFLTQWTKDSLNWFNIIGIKIKKDLTDNNNKSIQCNIQRRCENIASNLKAMTNSLLSKEFKKIHIDRLIINDPLDSEEKILITDHDEIKSRCDQHYSAQFRARNHKFDTDNEAFLTWKNEYIPKDYINEDWFSGIDAIPTSEEWKEALSKTKNSSAPGPSGIGYTMLKHLPESLNIVLRKLTFIVLQTGKVPVHWKVSQLYPIPKPKDWQHNLSITRPILLLECIRKTCLRIINNRLSNIISEHDLLKGNNFAALKGSSTQIPIHTINNMIEHAREHNNEIWIAFQDMAKAFDSVNLYSLQKAMDRIKIPSKISNLLINIFDQRQIQVITAVGNSNGFTARDGIDQGEVISPLLWRIFYDPLLCGIQQHNDQWGYHMDIKGIHKSKHEFHLLNNASFKSSCGAFADDTIWIGKSRQCLQNIVNLSSSFFVLNDIEINGDKSELLYIGPKKDNSSMSITMGKDNSTIIPPGNNTPIRYLGCWFKRNKGHTHILNKAITIIKEHSSLLKYKQTTAAQITYINNSIIIPKITYLWQTTNFTRHTVDKVHLPIKLLIKRKNNLCKTTPNSVLAHKGFLNFNNLADQHATYNITAFMDRLNSSASDQPTTLNRLKQTQFNNLITIPIFLALDDYNIIYNAANNINVDCLVKLKDLNISLKIDKNLLDSFHIDYIPSRENDLRTFLSLHHIAYDFKKTNQYGLFYTEQLTDQQGNPLDWKSVKLTSRNQKKDHPNGLKPLLQFSLPPAKSTHILLLPKNDSHFLIPTFLTSDSLMAE